MTRARFDFEKFRKLIQDGSSRSDAAAACGVQPTGLANLLRRKGWRLVKVEKLVLKRIPGWKPAKKRKVADCNDGLGTGAGAAPLHGSEGQ